MTRLTDRVYALLKTVPKGRVTTYKALGRAIGTKAYRAIGQAMRRNPYAFLDCDDKKLRVPCHRVVASNGTIGGFMGKKTGDAITKKVSLLSSEGIEVRNGKIVNFPSVQYTFAPNSPTAL